MVVKMLIKRILWFIFCVISIVAISYYGGAISYSFFYACLLLPIISLIYLFYVRIRFTIYQKLDTRNIVCGQSVPYSFILQNEDITVYTGVGVKLYADFSFVEGLEDNRKFRLFPGERIQFDTKLTCKYRGEYEVGVKEIVVYDFFGLFRIRYKIPSTIKALVTPRIISVKEFKNIPQISTMLESQYSHEKAELDVVTRDYIAGDSIGRIHWKSSARQQTLKVREEIGNEKQKITVLLDLERVSEQMEWYLPLENKILETVIAIIHYFALRNMGVKLIWQAEKLAERNIMNLQQFEQVFQELSQTRFRENRRAEDTIQMAFQNHLFSKSAILFWVIHELNPNVFSFAEQLAREEKTVILYVITKEDISEYIRQSSTRLYITAIDPEQDLSEVL